MANFSNTSELEGNKPQSTDIAIAIAAFICNISFCLINEFLLYLLVKVAQKEELIVAKLLKYYAIFNIACAPVVYIMVDGVIGLLPASVMYGNWVCDIIYFAAYFWHFFNINFSLMVGCMLYVHFVHRDKVNYYGKKFVNNVFAALIIIIPLIIVILSIPLPNHQAAHKFPWIEKCYGKQVNRGILSCSFDGNELHQAYGNWSNVASVGLQALCWIDLSSLIILASNILDGVFYILIYFHIKAYV